MKLTKMHLITGLMAAGSIVLLLPATLLLLKVAIGVTIGIFVGSTPMQGFLVLVALIALPGYGLFSLMWLLNHREVTPRDVPRYIWGGIVVGVITTTAGLSLYALFPFPPELRSYEETFNVVSLFGGPLLLTLILLIVMRPWQKNDQP